MATDQIQQNDATPEQEVAWGRVLIVGGTDWVKLGRKERGGKGDKQPENPDLLEPHILRSLSNIKITQIFTSCCACHFVALDVDGDAWSFGRNGSCALGVEGVDAVSENAPRRVRPVELGAQPGTRFVHAACGRNHTLLVGSNGSVWTAGANNFGQCGFPVRPEITSFREITNPENPSGDQELEHVVKAAAGVTFSLILTESGRVYSFGCGEHGQLGNGRTGEHITTGNKTGFDIVTEPVLVRDLSDSKILDVACGQQHSIAIDEQGVVYVWGYAGYCRLGLGNQVDVLKAKPVPQFAGPKVATMGARIAAGPTNSVVIDKQGMYWMAGKWKNSGEGSSGSPYSSFRYMQDIMACKIFLAKCGGVTHWALTPDDDGTTMTIAWGQNAANGELGLGVDEPKSATKPTRHIPLTGIDVIDIAAGQNTTLILARPNGKLSEMSRHPYEVEAPAACVVCQKETEDEDSPLECEKCDYPYHLGCLDPPLEGIPEGEWFCPDCEEDPGAPLGRERQPKKAVKVGAKRKAENAPADDQSRRKKASQK